MTSTLHDLTDGALRQIEGWDLFECDGIEHAPYELEKIDTPDVEGAHEFDDDLDAWKHVLTRACAGSGPHLRAVAFLTLYSFEEIVGIFHSLYYGEYRTYLQPRKEPKRPTRIVRDEDCPRCGWIETYAEVDFSKPTPGADAIGCYKCGWRITAGEQ